MQHTQGQVKCSTLSQDRLQIFEGFKGAGRQKGQIDCDYNIHIQYSFPYP